MAMFAHKYNMQRVAIVSEAIRAPACLLPLEGAYVLIQYRSDVRRSTRKRSRLVSFEDISHGILPVSRARLGERSGKSE